MPYRNSPPAHFAPTRVGAPLDLGVRALSPLTCCAASGLGIFAGSGVGKSVLLSMLARNVDADVSVIGLIGRRGRSAGVPAGRSRRGRPGALGGGGRDLRTNRR